MPPDALSRIPSCVSCNLYASHKGPEDLPISLDKIWDEQHKDLVFMKLLQTVAEGDISLKEQYEVLEDKPYCKVSLADNQLHYLCAFLVA